MTYHYKLTKDKKAIPCTMEEWGRQLNEMVDTNTKHVKDETIEGYRISTVWLGLDHSFCGGSPLLFETMIFKGNDFTDLYCTRYTTWEEAEEGHKRAVQWLHETILDAES